MWGSSAGLFGGGDPGAEKGLTLLPRLPIEAARVDVIDVGVDDPVATEADWLVLRAPAITRLFSIS